MTVVDVHAHHVPEALLQAVVDGAAQDVRAVDLDGKTAVAIADNAPTRPLKPRLRDLDERHSWMDEQGLDHQVLGTWADLFAYELPVDAADRWTRLLDDTLLEAVADDPRFSSLSTPPLQDPELAARAIHRAADDGHVGALIGTDVAGMELDDPSLDPVWAAAQERAYPVYVHPGYCADPRLQDLGLVNAVGRGIDTTIAASRLLLGGVLERFRDLRLVLSHGGAALPSLIGRLARNHHITPDTTDPLDGFARLYFDSVVHDPAVLAHLCHLASPGHVLLGSDYPFPIGDLEPTGVVDRAKLDDATRRSVLEAGGALFGGAR